MSDTWKMKILFHIIPSLISIIMLGLCIEKWPYLYYILLRWVVCFSAFFVAMFAYVRADEQRYDCKHKISTYTNWSFMCLFGFIALLFNPLLPIHLNRDIWVPIDLFTAGLFFIGLFAVRYKPD
jgi:hypothetical protein